LKWVILAPLGVDSMSFRRLPMKQLKELARLKFALGRSLSDIAGSLGVARSSVQAALKRFASAGLSWPLDAEMDDATLYALLYPNVTRSHLLEPDWAAVIAQLSGKGITRRLLWREYVDQHQELALGYAQFCAKLGAFADRREVSLRIRHQPGEAMFVDYAGMSMLIQDRLTGEQRTAQIFVAALGYSHAIYFDARWSQAIPDWLASMSASVGYFGGVSASVVPDNLKSAVVSPSRYEPVIQASFAEWAEHYGTAILPARVRAPDDKAKVENAVRIVEQQVLASLRTRTFFSLAELNEALATARDQLNLRPFQKRSGNRWDALIEERAALKPLPEKAFEYGSWRRAKVHIDYHVSVDKCFYSVPYQFVRQSVDVRVSQAMVAVFSNGLLIASHVKLTQPGQFHTVAEHMPQKHRDYVDRTAAGLQRRAQAIGEATLSVILAQQGQKHHPEVTYRSCLGILRLAQDYSPAQLEAACVRGLSLRLTSWRGIQGLIKAGLHPITERASSEKTAAAQKTAATSLSTPQWHENVRGTVYYNSATEVHHAH
jgi:transposase